MNMNRLHNMTNPHQGAYKRVLCICSAGLLRSPSAAVVLSQKPFNFNTRAAGLDTDFALVAVDEYLLAWADEVVCMTTSQAVNLIDMTDKPVICLDIPDDFGYRDPKLMKIIAKQYAEKSKALAKDKAGA
jgi:predicted protein tyrosine phosphatase